MDNRSRRGRLSLFQSTKIDNMLEKYSIDNNYVVPLFACF